MTIGLKFQLAARVGVVAGVAGMLPSVHAEGTIKDYLLNHSAGPLAASDIIDLGSAVHGVQTPKDLVIALSALGSRDTQAGFGIAVTPGRSELPGLAVRADRYASGDVWSRLWGGTTISYAQNKKTIASSDYAQSALAINLVYQPRGDDPIIVAYEALSGAKAGVCQGALDALETAEQSLETLKRRRIADEEARLGRELTLQELKAVNDRAEKEHGDALEKLKSLRTCAHAAADAAAKKWNANRVQLVLGQGWIEPSSGGGDRLTLGTYVTLSVALRAGVDGLVNLTGRRAADELDLGTIAGSPAYKTTNTMGLRYTHRAGKANDLYGMAEVSNVKESAVPTASNAAFKYAVGIDRKLNENFWLEFRYGRSRIADGTQLENKALFSLKFSPESTLDKQVK